MTTRRGFIGTLAKLVAGAAALPFAGVTASVLVVTPPTMITHYTGAGQILMNIGGCLQWLTVEELREKYGRQLCDQLEVTYLGPPKY